MAKKPKAEIKIPKLSPMQIHLMGTVSPAAIILSQGLDEYRRNKDEIYRNYQLELKFNLRKIIRTKGILPMFCEAHFVKPDNWEERNAAFRPA